VLDLAREALQFRYRLLPYLYAAFLEVSETGAPVQRPLVFDHQYDPAVYALDDEYLLGGDLLVAPVFVAGATARHVYLPAGGWYDWHSDAVYEGRRWLLVDTPMERIPIFARAGAVIPMWPEAPVSTANHHPHAIELHLFVPLEDGTHRSFLQEDDGETTAALGGARYRTTFEVTRRGNRVALRGEVEGDGYPEFDREAFHVVVHGAGVARREEIPNAGTAFTLDVDV
jgi:alpha-glucosidase